MSAPESQKVAIITGASKGIGAGLVDAFRRSGYAVVGTARSIRRSDEPGYLTVGGDIGQAETADHVVEQAMNRFGRIDTLINNAGIFIGKPFTEYTVDDYAAVTAVNLAGFFHITQRAIRHMRPRVALDPYRTGIPGTFICSAASPPGAGAHGMCGYHAAGSALRHLRITPTI